MKSSDDIEKILQEMKKLIEKSRAMAREHERLNKRFGELQNELQKAKSANGVKKD